MGWPQKGYSEFYEGEMSSKLIALFKSTGIPLTARDLRTHTGQWVDPISTTFHGITVHELPLPTQGATTLALLNVLEEANATYGDRFHSNPADFYHFFLEAVKLVYADRAEQFADPEYIAMGSLEE